MRNYEGKFGGNSDTPLEVEILMIEGMRRMSVADKWKAMNQMAQTLVAIVQADVRKAHPDADEQEIRLRVASRYLPPEMLKKAFGWDVKEKRY